MSQDCSVKGIVSCAGDFVAPNIYNKAQIDYVSGMNARHSIYVNNINFVVSITAAFVFSQSQLQTI